MIAPGNYIISMVSFSREGLKPRVTLIKDGEFIHVDPVSGPEKSLIFDTSIRYCSGWRDIENGTWYVCEAKAIVEAKYEQCRACMDKTGFNPAFYYADSISRQQEERNLQPHVLYLAYVAEDVVKVGIAHEPRKVIRLLEQGARDAIILETFPSANIARTYEEKIARIDGVVEHVQIAVKLKHLQRPYDRNRAAETLSNALKRIKQKLNLSFNSEVLSFDNNYCDGAFPDLSDAIDMTDKCAISGKMIGMVGSILVSKYNDEYLLLPLKKFVGYPLQVSNGVAKLELPARQATLF